MPAFAFVSGYFGVTFRMSKIVRLLITALICNVVPCWLGGCPYWKTLCSNWYLWAYLILLLVSPIVNTALRQATECERRYMLFGVAGLAVWSWLSDMYLVRDFMPRPAGLGMLSFASVFYSYVLAWGYRNAWFCVFTKQLNIWVLLFCCCMMPVAGHYASPFTLIFVLSLFRFLERLDLRGLSTTFISRVADTGFAVYILHANAFGIKAIACMNEYLTGLGVPRIVSMISVGVGVFVSGVVSCLIGKMVLLPINRVYSALLARMDVVFTSYVLKINGKIR